MSADIPGVDYSAKFEVPVFHTPETDDPPSTVGSEHFEAGGKMVGGCDAASGAR